MNNLKKTKLVIDRQPRLNIDELVEHCNNLQNRIDKAIEYVNSLSSKGRDCEIYYDIKKEILDILKGDDEN